jgi:hypothetical protein
MSDITQARKDLVARILKGDGRASHATAPRGVQYTGAAEPLAGLINKLGS